jgi:hypothetical protein
MRLCPRMVKYPIKKYSEEVGSFMNERLYVEVRFIDKSYNILNLIKKIKQ